MILLEHHKQAKREIITRFKQLADVAESVGMITLARDIRTTRIPKLESEKFHLVVLGEFNHGKSTFVNALLGEAVLPAGITPTNATINHLVWAEAPRARAYVEDGQSVEVDPRRLADWVTIEGKEVATHPGGIRYVEVGWPAP